MTGREIFRAKIPGSAKGIMLSGWRYDFRVALTIVNRGRTREDDCIIGEVCEFQDGVSSLIARGNTSIVECMYRSAASELKAAGVSSIKRNDAFWQGVLDHFVAEHVMNS